MSKDRKRRISFYVVTAVLMIPYIMNILYSLPSADDFSMASHYVTSSNLLAESFRQAGSMYMKWSGEWFYSFIQTLINPLVLFGYSGRMFGIELAVFFVLFICAVLMCTWRVSKKLFGCDDSTAIYLISFVILVLVLNTGIYNEIFYWFVGSSYMIEVTLSLVVISLIIDYSIKDDIRTAVMISVIGFFTCNGLMVVSLICLVYLALFLPAFIRKQKRMISFIPFLFCFAGGIFSVIAPGNYARHDVVDSTGIHVGAAIKNTIQVEVSYLYANLNNEFLGMMIITVIVLSYLYARKRKGLVRYYSLIKAILFFLVVMFFVIFPVTLGYSSDNMPNRMQYMINTYMILGLSFLAVDTGFIIASHMGSQLIDKRSVLLTALVLIIGMYIGPLSHGSIGLIPYVQQIVCHSEAVSCHDEWVSILDEIKTSNDRDVVVDRQSVTKCSMLKVPDLGEDAGKWENTVTAKYLGKDSVRMLTEEK